jgi:hypothetical protein
MEEGKGNVERSQIYLISPGAEGKERASILTVSARQDAAKDKDRERAERQPVGMHRARRQVDGLWIGRLCPWNCDNADGVSLCLIMLDVLNVRACIYACMCIRIHTFCFTNA